MVEHSKLQQVSGNLSFKSKNKQLESNKHDPLSELTYLPCSQINLHRSENPTAQFYYNIELNDDLPYLAFIQEPYCAKGKPKHLPGNGITFYHSSSDLTNPRASMTVSKNIANQFFFQQQYSNRDMATCSIELPKIKLYVSSTVGPPCFAPPCFAIPLFRGF